MSTAPHKAPEQGPPPIILTPRPAPTLVAPPNPDPPQAHHAAPSAQTKAPFSTGRNRHLVTLGSVFTMLGISGGAYAMDGGGGVSSEVLMVAPAVTLAGQAVMALLGYLRDYGKDKLDAEKQRTQEALARAEKEAQRCAELQAEIARRDAREDEKREAENQRLREQVEALMLMRDAKTPNPKGE